MIIIGVDPGQSGAIAVLKRSRKKVSIVEVIEDGSLPLSLLHLIKLHKPCLVLIEKQQAMKGQGVSSTFTTGKNFGMLEGIIVAAGTPYQLVHPKSWMHYFYKEYSNIDILEELRSSNIKESKKKNISICSYLFPSAELITPRGRWKDGVADALLIAMYGFNL